MSEKQLICLIIIVKTVFCTNAKPVDTARVNTLNDLCFENLYSDIGLAKKQAFEAFKIAKAIKFVKGEAMACNRIGVVYDVSGNYDSALFFYQKSYQINLAIKNLKGQGSTLSNIGLTYWNKGDYNNALNAFYAAIPPLEAVSHYLYLGNCYNNIGLVFVELKNSRKARNYFYSALKYYERGENEFERANVLCNIAMILAQEDQLDSSIAINSEAIKIYEKERDYYNLGKSYNNIADEYKQNGDTVNALSSYLKAIDCHKKAGNITGIGETLIYLGELYQELHQTKLSQKYINEAFAMSYKIKSPKVLSNIFYHYALVKKLDGDYKTAAEFLARVKVMRDTIFRAETSRLIASTEAQFGIERKANENKQLQQQNKIQELQISKAKAEIAVRKQMTYGIIGFSVFIVIGGIIYYRRRQVIQQLTAKNLVHEAEQQQRVSISHDLHDNVGAQLSYIVSNLDVMENMVPDNKRLKSVADMSKQAILTLRETVWALNNESVTTEAFADKFKQYAIKMLDFNTTLQCNFHENIQHSIVLRPMQALNLFRICQEAFSNAMRHSQASQIDVFFYNSEFSVFDFKIEDNGRGFIEAEGLAKGHFGLQNMQARAGEVGAEYYINSESGVGTTIIINLLKYV